MMGKFANVPRSVSSRILWMAVMVTFVAGCASSSKVRQRLIYPQAFDTVESILVVPFENLTPFPEAGLIVADLMADELRGWQGYRLIDRHRIEAKARRGEVTLPLHWGRAEAVQFGRTVGADAVLYGTIIEFGYLREHRAVTELATFAVAAKLASADSGRVIWSGLLLGTGGSDLSPNRPPLTDVSRRVMGKGFAELFAAYNDYRNRVATEGGS